MSKDLLPPHVEKYRASPDYHAFTIPLPKAERRYEIADFIRRGGNGELKDSSGQLLVGNVNNTYPFRDYANCATFALSLAGQMLHPPITTELWNMPTKTLQTYGFEIVSGSQQPNDVIAYRIVQASVPREVVHFGLVQENGTILSKWGMGEAGIYVHKIDAVPPDLGDVAFFYRYLGQ